MNNRFKPVFKCFDSYKEKFKDAKCLLTISVGQEVHEGEKFAATIDLVNRSFKACVLLIDDILQRYTMALYANNGMSELDFYDISISEGDAWLSRNEKLYSRFDIPVDIVRWDRWLSHPDFDSKVKMILHELEISPTFKTAFSVTIAEFLRRFSNRTEVDDKQKERMYRVCLDYLVEECAAMCLWVDMSCHFEVYPAKRNPAMQITHERFIIPSNPDLLHSVAIKFKSRRKPQTFTYFPNYS